MKHEDLTRRIIGCAMKMHSTLGNGFQEVIYQHALDIEMKKNAVEFVREMEMPIHYDGIVIGTRRVDFFVQDIIMVELKAIAELNDLHLAQTQNYLEAYNLPIGLLLNFGSKASLLKESITPSILTTKNNLKSFKKLLQPNIL